MILLLLVQRLDIPGFIERSYSLQVKINQFPGMHVIGRKDCLAKSYQEMVKQFGIDHFNFHPETFILPEDHEQLARIMADNKRRMIMKPPNWFNGMGIKIIEKTGEHPRK